MREWRTNLDKEKEEEARKKQDSSAILLIKQAHTLVEYNLRNVNCSDDIAEYYMDGLLKFMRGITKHVKDANVPPPMIVEGPTVTQFEHFKAQQAAQAHATTHPPPPAYPFQGHPPGPTYYDLTNYYPQARTPIRPTIPTTPQRARHWEGGARAQTPSSIMSITPFLEDNPHLLATIEQVERSSAEGPNVSTSNK